MNSAGMIRGVAVCLAVLGFCLPQPLLAAVQTDQSPAATDVALQQGNVLTGRVLDSQGAMQANVPVVLLARGEKLLETRTDQSGSFAFANLRGGVYQVMSTGGVGVFRVWMPGTAPPAAQPTALIVTGQDLVRGQCHPIRQGCAQARFWLSHPCVIAGIVAASVAIPVALINRHEKKPHSPH